MSISTCPILYRDQHVVVINKTSGLLSHPNPDAKGKKPGTGPACAFLGAYDLAKRRYDTPEGPVWLVHRIDQDVSGVLMGAFNEETAHRFRSLFEAQKIEKHYIVLVGGRVPASGHWSDHLAKHQARDRVRSIVRRSSGHSNAELLFKTKRGFPRSGLSLVDVRLITGKTHQIRVQFAHHGHPVAGDGVYGDFKMNRELRKSVDLRRLFLHARSLEFRHPITGKTICADAPLPQELTIVISRLH